ncbi:hypothetical protein VCHENC02_0403B, partial [Vibrio harveyi]
IC